MKSFTAEQIKQLNAKYSPSVFFEAIVVTRTVSPLAQDAFANYPSEFSFGGHTYKPLRLAFVEFEANVAMPLPAFKVAMSNVGDQVRKYLVENQIAVKRQDVKVQVLRRDEHNAFSEYDHSTMKALLLTRDHRTATLVVGLQISLKHPIPHETIETQRYPGIRADVVRVGT